MDTVHTQAHTPDSQATPARLQVQVSGISRLADEILGFELKALSTDRPLPAFTAGAHIDVHLPDGLIRQYSLCNDPRETHRYCLGVLREPNSRGGSRAMHDRVKVGDRLSISSPRSHFQLNDTAQRHMFLAGGIGITPILSMLHAVQARGQDFHLTYCTRSPQRTAFLDELRPMIAEGHVSVHHDGGKPGDGLDLAALLQTHRPGTHLYSCGPGGFLDAVARATVHWPAGTCHSERFSASSSAPALDADQAFHIRLARCGTELLVPAGLSIVDVLMSHGITVDTSCREGYCGTCMTRYLAGQPIHRDSVLDAEDREEFVMVCCARATGGPLVLDL